MVLLAVAQVGCPKVCESNFVTWVYLASLSQKVCKRILALTIVTSSSQDGLWHLQATSLDPLLSALNGPRQNSWPNVLGIFEPGFYAWVTLALWYYIVTGYSEDSTPNAIILIVYLWRVISHQPELMGSAKLKVRLVEKASGQGIATSHLLDQTLCQRLAL